MTLPNTNLVFAAFKDLILKLFRNYDNLYESTDKKEDVMICYTLISKNRSSTAPVGFVVVSVVAIVFGAPTPLMRPT